jgi:hypothetical protein
VSARWNSPEVTRKHLSIAGYVHAVGGDRAKAEGYIQQMVERKRERYVPPYNVALLFAGLGEHESALHSSLARGAIRGA